MYNNDIIPGFDEETNEHLRIKLEKIGDSQDCIVIHLRGFASRQYAGFFKRKITETSEFGFRWIILECAEFITQSSSVAGALTAILKAFRKSKGGLVITEAKPILRYFIAANSLDIFFKQKNTLQETIEFLKSKAWRLPQFPVAINCLNCGLNLTAPSFGFLSCNACKTAFSVDIWGDLTIIKKGSS
jgi:anti-anti-sigma regulatory factor